MVRGEGGGSIGDGLWGDGLWVMGYSMGDALLVLWA